MAVSKFLGRQTLFLFLDGQHNLPFFFNFPPSNPNILSPLFMYLLLKREGAVNASYCVWLANEEENVIVALLQQILKDVQYLPLG